MSFSFGGGQNPYSQGAKDDVFVKPKVDIDFGSIKPQKTVNDISLFDITSEDDLNDTGRRLTSADFLADVAPEFDGPGWLGLTGKGSFAPEPTIMKNSFLQAPRMTKDDNGISSYKQENNGNDWNWNTFA
jgi:hypothetical protein